MKYKSCCIGKGRSGFSKGIIALIIAIAVIAAIGLLPSVTGDKAKQAGPVPAASSTPVAQPPGPAPVGKVWSAEHGHWHDASPVQVAPAGQQPAMMQPPPAPVAPTPQPPGPAPAGKVWSAEHGHWHDVATSP